MKIIPPVPSAGKEKSLEGLPLVRKESSSPSSIPAQKKSTDFPADFLSRILVQLPKRGEILNRLSLIPPGERFQALPVLLTLEERNVTLDPREWNELWALIRNKSVPFPGSDEEVKNLFFKGGNERGEELLVQGDQSRIIILVPLNENGQKGQIVVRSEEGSDNLFIRLESSRRHWEFHLIKPKKKGILSTLDVFTNDRKLIENPPGDWEEFRKKMKKKSIRVERVIKFLREPVFLSENRRRELDHLVDIVL